NTSLKPDDLKVILNAYSRWGVRYVVIFNSPNLKTSWVQGTWSQEDLVERFLDRYLPLARIAEQVGLIPVFPPLQPGGDYWDTSFLKKMLVSIKRRRSIESVTNLHVAASAQTFNKPLDWGHGATTQWQSPSPYMNPGNSQDQIGFRTCEWYTEIIQNALGITPKIMLFWYGSSDHLNIDSSQGDSSFHELVELTQAAPSSSDELNDPALLGENIIACNFWLLSSSRKMSQSKSAWFNENAEPMIDAVKEMKNIKPSRKDDTSIFDDLTANQVAKWMYPIDHYLLLPAYDWGVPEHILERVRPIIRQEQPTIGFSLSEASLARKVTVWNENNVYTENDLCYLRESGCQIKEHIARGIDIATS
ncbi:MAG: hypothetical protein ABIG43_02585, partial [Chloroflexota bacterium]